MILRQTLMTMLIFGTTTKKQKNVCLDAGTILARHQRHPESLNVFLPAMAVDGPEKEKPAKDFNREECLAQQTALEKDSLNVYLKYPTG